MGGVIVQPTCRLSELDSSGCKDVHFAWRRLVGTSAEFERELIRSRTGEGRKRAKDRGVKFGRPRKMTPHQRQEAIQVCRERPSTTS